MIRTITGLFDTTDDAHSVANDLINQGILREDISMVARDANDESTRQQEVGAEHSVGSGAVGGSVVGGAVGLLVGAGLLAIPGIGPVLAIGPLAAAIGSIGATVGSTALGAGVGASVGGIAGALMGTGVPEESAHIYAEGVRRGGVLLTVSVDAAMAERINVDAVMRRYGVVDIEERSKQWHKTDWHPSLATDTNQPDFAQGQRSAPPNTNQPDFAQGQRSTPPNTNQPDFAQGQRSTPPNTNQPGFAQGQRSTPPNTNQPDFAQGQRVTPLSNNYPNATTHGMHDANGNNDHDFQTHYHSTVAAGGRPYSDYAPAYIFGTDMATDAGIHGHSWDTVEPDLRRTWNLKYRDTWDEFKTAIRYAWEKGSGQG
ncbi:hypothetical protein [Candidatus Chloroploca asiatica]|uniref:General stress protein 17M-like domain-containing protein n=1 Tax=Candidatus Chloroploca asiatica TaxID=1506545 RepID=A0A2H3KJ54_9CHLR|nr:hypothetical protein [Candidatus Chloroploca asiatica]PDV97918.1 hypothetical protein A9Q02_16985 [Candidatus Chloroploca asiatica]